MELGRRPLPLAAITVIFLACIFFRLFLFTSEEAVVLEVSTQVSVSDSGHKATETAEAEKGSFAWAAADRSSSEHQKGKRKVPVSDSGHQEGGGEADLSRKAKAGRDKGDEDGGEVDDETGEGSERAGDDKEQESVTGGTKVEEKVGGGSEGAGIDKEQESVTGGTKVEERRDEDGGEFDEKVGGGSEGAGDGKELESVTERKEEVADPSVYPPPGPGEWKRQPPLNWTALGRGGYGRECGGKLVYVYEMPSKYNEDIIRNCMRTNEFFCKRFPNWGLGPALKQETTFDGETTTKEMLGDLKYWFNTHMFSIELTYHARMLQHPCRTENPEEAMLFFIPYYAALGLEPLLEKHNLTASNELPLGAAKWLQKLPYINCHGGHDHFMVIGENTYNMRWDNTSMRGCSFLRIPTFQNVTKLTFDRDPWNTKWAGVPYPTYFHPHNYKQLRKWQERVRASKRKHLVTFVGSKKRPESFAYAKNFFDFRRMLADQCEAWGRCAFLDCKFVWEGTPNVCQVPANPLHMFLSSHFCLQPVGDTAPRKSIFDAMLAGCIPVFFFRDSAYNQYLWYLPKNRSSYSVYIDMREVQAGNTSIKEVLSKYSLEQVITMRNVIIDDIMPKMIVFNPLKYKGQEDKDAVDYAVQGMLVKVERFRAGLQHDFPNPWLMDNWPDHAYSLLQPVPENPPGT